MVLVIVQRLEYFDEFIGQFGVCDYVINRVTYFVIFYNIIYFIYSKYKIFVEFNSIINE